MLLPMPPMPAQMGPASESLRAMSPWMLALLVLQTVLCSVRIVVFLDILGGFIPAIGIGIGWYAWKDDMNITFICYWGVMCLINGAFDFVKWIDSAVHAQMPLFSSKASTTYNVLSAVQLLIPLSVLAAAPFAYRAYKVHSEGDARASPGFSSLGPAGPSAPEERRSLLGRPSQQYTAFAGSGQRLGTA
ncbi:unnamed protein product [Prorocentrum cordatum]|uniref:Glycerophosphocholine acyltransferase 1 n=1 Tax=Prorocentrum cordatum TaxID=2364126 RepID=A0ABN9TL52_9DINO|nr:unnamed protein product [Polarella glacialis]